MNSLSIEDLACMNSNIDNSGLACIVEFLRLHGIATDLPTLIQRTGLMPGRVMRVYD